MSRITALFVGVAALAVIDGRRGRGWLRTRLVLEWATVRADGRAHIPARLRAATVSG
jgi:hypothetical protein